jgi:uncharacterized protein (DUF1499 family)
MESCLEESCDMFKISVVCMLLIGVIILGVRYYIVPKAISNDWRLVDFESIKLPSSPNFYLSCPKDFCPSTIDFAISPVFDVSVVKLQQRFDKMLAKQERIQLLDSTNGGLKRVYVQKSALWNFPDFINVEFVAINDKHSSIALFSQSRFGYSDLGVNKKRIINWLTQLK